MALTGDPREWDPTTKQGTVWAALADIPSVKHFPGATKTEGRVVPKCPTCRTAYLRLLPGLGEAPLVFVSGGSPLPKGSERARRLRILLTAVHEHAHDFRPGEDDVPAPAPAPAPAPRPEPKALPSEIERFLREIERLRAFCAERGHDTLGSMRVTIDGVKAIKAGVPVDALLASIGAAWQADTKSQGRIPAWDPMTFGERPHAFAHAASEQVARLVQADVPVWLHGPAGTGKSSAAKHAAEVAGLTYYEVNLAGAMASAIKGKDRLKEFVEAEFERAYEHGGLICLEEFDAAHPTVATAINNAIAGDVFHNDANGRAVKRHPDFRIVATANTIGTGATKEFNSRNKLDGATLDRFRMGRVFVGLDTTLERTIIDSMLAA